MEHALPAGSARPAPASAISVVRDLIELGKPRVTALVVFTAAAGLGLAPATRGVIANLTFLFATGLLVAAANGFNCVLERDVDARMHRTQMRPLPAGRLSPATAATWAFVQSAAAIGILAWATNAVTTLLGAVALATYVLVYTPLKRVSPIALHVGAIPGAIPPLMGWTAATGSIAAPGWALFVLLFVWQLPHFLAISIYLRDDYARGGLRVVPVVRGLDDARRSMLAYAGLLTAFSLLPVALGVAGTAYFAVASVAGFALVAAAARGLRRRAGSAWARRVFLYTIVYLPVVVVALLADARLP